MPTRSPRDHGEVDPDPESEVDQSFCYRFYSKIEEALIETPSEQRENRFVIDFSQDTNM